MHKNLDAIKSANANSTAPHWFDEATMEFFETSFESEALHDHFVTGELLPGSGSPAVRRFTIRHINAEDHIVNVGDLGQYETAAEAIAAMKMHVLGIETKVPETV